MGNFSDRGLLSTAVLLLSWSFLSYALRVWVKLRKSDGWDTQDSLTSAAFLAAVCNVTTTCVAVSHGYSERWISIAETDRVVAEKAYYASQIFYIGCLGLTRLSVNAFLHRLARDSHKKKLVTMLSWIYAVFTIGGIFAIALRPAYGHPWSTLDGAHSMYIRWLILEIIGLVVEFVLWATAAWLVWGLQMPVRKRVSILAILATRFIIVPFVALRLVHLSPSKSLDTSRPRLIAGIFTEIVMNFSFILSSITCAKPFLKPFHSGYFIGTSNQKSFHGNAKSDSKSNGNSYRILDATTSQSVNDRSIQQDDRVVHNADSYGDKGLFRPEPISHHVAVSSKAGRHQPSTSDHMAIAQTKSWAVSYEGIDEIAREQRN